MRKSLSLAVALSITLTGSAWASSDLFGTTVYCSSGAIKTCASFMITTAAGSGANSGGTVVDIFVRNLQGSDPNDNTLGSFLTKFGLLNGGMGSVFDIPGPNLVISTSGTVGTGGTPLDNWDFSGSCSEIGSPLLCPVVINNPIKNGAIQGCTLVSSPSDYFKTCDVGFPGSVRFHFETSARWYASDAKLSWKVQTGGGSYECVTTATSGDARCVPSITVTTTTTPEPGTMSLLGIGLVGLVAAGRVRRRR